MRTTAAMGLPLLGQDHIAIKIRFSLTGIHATQ